MPDEKLSTALTEAYYTPGGYGGPTALQAKLKQQGITSSLGPIRAWLKAQEISQLYNAKPANNAKAHFTTTRLNELHQADLVFVYQDPHGYKYILCVVDTATRYKAAYALKSKTAQAVADGLQEIYKHPPLAWPRTINVDEGGEFKGATTKLLEQHGVRIRRAEPGHHRSQAFVENFNRQLAQRLYRAMAARRLITGNDEYEWASALPTLVENMNNEPTRLLGMTPAKAAAKGVVEPMYSPIKARTRSELLPRNAMVRVRITPDRQEGGRQRATDPRFSAALYRIQRAVYDPQGIQPTLYFIEGLRHGYQAGDLQVVKEAQAQPPPMSALDAKEEYVVERLDDRRKVGNRILFLVKWKGYSDAERTWEPRTTLVQDVPHLVKAYERH